MEQEQQHIKVVLMKIVTVILMIIIDLCFGIKILKRKIMISIMGLYIVSVIQNMDLDVQDAVVAPLEETLNMN